MLQKRVIVCLDVRDGRVVKGVNFTGLRDVGDPVELAARYQEEGADEIVFLDISASTEGRGTLLDVVRRTAERLFIPLTVGGGVSGIDDIEAALRSGADKVSINTAAVKHPELLTQASQRFGAQAVVASIDARLERRQVEVAMRADSGSQQIAAPDDPRAPALPWFRVFTHGGATATELDAVTWAEQCSSLGAGEILITSIDQDGRRDGYDLELTGRIVEAVKVPVIASGGAGDAQHLVDAFLLAGADAALAAGMFHDGSTTVREVKRVLAAAGIPVRLDLPEIPA
ncbi:MAG TPA: imidazole glycerol phosphate synthase subunit HisF [Longimicrobiales bacterium]|nr:imidazole glycerol phosphate synthase subunit HisF [Longimicrobiales bacterium]